MARRDGSPKDVEEVLLAGQWHTIEKGTFEIGSGWTRGEGQPDTGSWVKWRERIGKSQVREFRCPLSALEAVSWRGEA